MYPNMRWWHCNKHNVDFPSTTSCPFCDKELEEKNERERKALEENDKIRAKIPREISIEGVKGRQLRVSQYYSTEGFVTDVIYRFKTEELRKIDLKRKRRNGIQEN